MPCGRPSAAKSSETATAPAFVTEYAAISWIRADARVGADVDHRAAALLAHGAEAGAGDAEERRQVDLDQLAEGGLGRLLDRSRCKRIPALATSTSSRPPPSCERLLDRAVGGGAIARVALQERAPVARATASPRSRCAR